MKAENKQLRFLSVADSALRPGEVSVDLFAGGGGWSEGFQWATGVPPAIAVNHDEHSIAMHTVNHPETEHWHEDVFHVDPLKATRGRAVGWLHGSPDCRHFSRAKGSVPNTARALSRKIRGLAWVIVRWAAAVRPRIISLENVSEFCFPVDTAVLTKRGVIPIGDVKVGDEVWTHNARWKPVTKIARRVAETVSVAGYGNSIVETTPNHRFYARQYAPRITKSGKFGRHEARLLEPEWVRADQLADRGDSSEYARQYSGYAWASPVELPRYWMRLPGELGIDTSAPAFFYMLGRWVGDGWVKKRKGRVDQDLVRICANRNEADDLQDRLSKTGLAWRRSVHTDSFIADGQVVHNCTWGPLHQQGKNAGAPMKKRRGETFRKFVTALESLGYVVEWRELRACDFGAPTSRKRLFLVARCDGQAIRWPEPTHGPGRAHPYRTAAECIDWSIECPSIFGRKRDLAEATQRRIAEGIRRFILNNERPFIVNLTHGGRLEDLDAPFRTLTAAHRGEKAVIAPTLVQTGYGERKGQKPRALDIEAPLGTVVAGGSKHALVAAFLAKHYGGVIGHGVDRPLSTITAKDHHSVVACHLEAMYSNSKGHPVDAPLPTITAQSNHHALVAATLSKYYGSDECGQPLTVPLHTIPTKDRFALVAAFLRRFIPEMTGDVVTVNVGGESYAIVDIGMRMLAPRELARGNGFPDSYVLIGSTTQQVARIGNSVPPHFAKAIVAANLRDTDEEERAA